jgi:ABC-type uncharacterized transport system auxiliary subunit
MSRFTVLVAVLVGLTSIAACTAEVVPEDRYYRLEVAQANAGLVHLDGVMEIERFDAVGLTAGRAIVYTSDANSLLMQEYHYDFWHEPPSVMLRDSMINYLRQSSVARSIVTPELRARARYLLNGRILRLETQRGKTPMSVVELELGVSDLTSGTVLMVRSYRTDVPAGDASVEAGIIAANKAVSDIFARFLKDLQRL